MSTASTNQTAPAAISGFVHKIKPLVNPVGQEHYISLGYHSYCQMPKTIFSQHWLQIIDGEGRYSIRSISSAFNEKLSKQNVELYINLPHFGREERSLMKVIRVENEVVLRLFDAAVVNLAKQETADIKPSWEENLMMFLFEYEYMGIMDIDRIAPLFAQEPAALNILKTPGLPAKAVERVETFLDEFSWVFAQIRGGKAAVASEKAAVSSGKAAATSEKTAATSEKAAVSSGKAAVSSPDVCVPTAAVTTSSKFYWKLSKDFITLEDLMVVRDFDAANEEVESIVFRRRSGERPMSVSKAVRSGMACYGTDRFATVASFNGKVTLYVTVTSGDFPAPGEPIIRQDEYYLGFNMTRVGCPAITFSPCGRYIAMALHNLDADKDKYHLVMFDSSCGQHKKVLAEDSGAISDINFVTPNKVYIRQKYWNSVSFDTGKIEPLARDIVPIGGGYSKKVSKNKKESMVTIYKEDSPLVKIPSSGYTRFFPEEGGILTNMSVDGCIELEIIKLGDPSKKTVIDLKNSASDTNSSYQVINVVSFEEGPAVLILEHEDCEDHDHKMVDLDSPDSGRETYTIWAFDIETGEINGFFSFRVAGDVKNAFI